MSTIINKLINKFKKIISKKNVEYSYEEEYLNYRKCPNFYSHINN